VSVEEFQERETRLLSALRPFAELGAALTKHGPHDNSPFVSIPDNDIILSNRAGWIVTAGQLRRAYDPCGK
jgi:hypothetical protein